MNSSMLVAIAKAILVEEYGYGWWQTSKSLGSAQPNLEENFIDDCHVGDTLYYYDMDPCRIVEETVVAVVRGCPVILRSPGVGRCPQAVFVDKEYYKKSPLELVDEIKLDLKNFEGVQQMLAEVQKLTVEKDKVK